MITMLTLAFTILALKLFEVISLSWNWIIFVELVLLIAALFELKLIYKFIDRHTK